MIKAAFFDLDGTLVNSHAAYLASYFEAFAQFGYDFKIIEANCKGRNYRGRRLNEALKEMCELSGISEAQIPLKKLIEAQEQALVKISKEKVFLLPGTIATLKRAKEQLHFTALVSSGPKDYVLNTINRFDLKQYFDYVITAEEVTVGKPDPACYLLAYANIPANLQIEKPQVLVVEDAANGIVAGKAAGLKTVYIPVPGRDEGVKVYSDWQLISLEQLNFVELN